MNLYKKFVTHFSLLITGLQFEITKLEVVERTDDVNTISAKVGDFTSDTIKKLIKDGYEFTWRKYPQYILQ